MPELLLPRRFASVAAACERAEALVRGAGWTEADVTRVALALGEAVGNAVEHGVGDDVSLTLDLDEHALAVCVDDGGPGPATERLETASLPDDPLATSGRGLYILRHLADEVRVDDTGGLCLTIRPRS